MSGLKAKQAYSVKVVGRTVALEGEHKCYLCGHAMDRSGPDDGAVETFCVPSDAADDLGEETYSCTMHPVCAAILKLAVQECKGSAEAREVTCLCQLMRRRNGKGRPKVCFFRSQ